jgi:hypothetical protein
MVKGINEINNTINEFLKPFDLTAELGTDFDYCFFENKIHYALVVGDLASRLFLKNAESRFPDVHADVFLWSLLHEIGHSETIDDLEDETENLCREIKVHLYDNNLPIENIHEIYFNCPDEVAATDWAGEYLMSHSKEITVFWNKLQPLIERFYKINGVEK